MPVTQAHKRALQQGRAALEALLGLPLPESWPEFPEAFVPDTVPPEAEPAWPGFFFLAGPTPWALVGNGGFAGPPTAQGVVEIGYEIAPSCRNRGYATAAARELVQLAFERPGIHAVVAHTLAAPNASNAVLQKLGMVFTAELPNPEVGRVWRWELTRAAWQR